MNFKQAAGISAIITAATALAANAQNATGNVDVTAGLAYSIQSDADYDLSEFFVSLSGALGGGVGYQADVFALHFTYDPDDYVYGGNFHLTYEFSDDLVAGLVYGYEYWEGSEYTFIGLEAAYSSGQWELYGNAADYFNNENFGLAAVTYDFGGASVGVELGFYGDLHTTAVVASADIGNGFEMNMRLMSPSDEEDIIGIGFSRDFGAGSTFRRPDYVANFGYW